MSDLCNQITDGTHFTPTYVSEGVPFVSVKDVREFEISFDNTKYIRKEEHNKLSKRCNPAVGDILLTKVGTIGLAAVVPDHCPEFSLFVSVCLIKPNNKIDPYFFCAVLNTSIARIQFSRDLKGIGVPDLHLENIAETLIPCPPIEEQYKLVAKIQVARKSRKKKLAQADELLAGIDKFLLKEVGVGQVSHSRRRCFGIRLRQVEGPINPDRYSALGMERNVEGVTIRKVGDILENKISPLRVDGNGEWDWIRIDDLPNEPLGIDKIRTEYGKNMQGTFFTVEKNDILIARLGPTILNRKFVLCPETKRRTIASPEFIVLRCYKGWNSMLVLWILKTTFYRELIYSKCRGGTPSRYRIIGADLGALPFPSINEKKQDELVNVIKGKLEAIRDLRDEAERDWQRAKSEFEAELFGSLEEPCNGG